MTPLLSVVIPAYNNAAFLKEAIDSALADTTVDLELIVADHSSSDNTDEILEDYRDDPRIQLAKTDAGGGAERNWRRVTELATGSFIKLLPGDDIVTPGSLRRQLTLLQETEDAVLVASKRRIIDANGKTLIAQWGLKGINAPMPGIDAVRLSVRAGTNLLGEPGAVMMRRSVLEEVGGWFGKFPYLIDQASYSRVLMRGTFVPDLNVGAAFRMSKGQWSVALTKEQAKQAIGFHRWLAAQYPQSFSQSDIQIGNAKALLAARARRLSYWILSRRMS